MNAATVPYIQRRVEAVRAENEKTPFVVRLTRRIPDKRKRSGYRVESVWGVVEYIAVPSHHGQSPMKLATIEASEVSYADLSSSTFSVETGAK